MITEIQWLMGGAGKVATVVVGVGELSAVVRFRTWVPPVGIEQRGQVCLQHRVVLVQI